MDLSALSAETTYYYWVMCACGDTPSDVRSFTTDAACPSVTGITLTNQYHYQVRVNWTTSSATNCNVRYSDDDGESWTNVVLLNPAATSATIVDLTVGTTYTIQVKPTCSADGWVETTYTPTCPTPGALSLSGKKFNGVTISWSAVTGVSSYNLRYRKGSDSWTTVNDIAALTYTISSGLVTGEEYTIELQSECGGSYSSTTYTPEASDPAVVSVGSITEISATASWTDMSGEGAIGYQYILVARDAAVNWAGATSVGAGTFSASLTGLTVGTDYDVYVRTKYSASLYSAGKKRQFTTKVEKPTGLTKGTVTSESAQFSWTAGGGATQYQILCLPSATTPTESDWSSSTLVNTTSGTITGLSANTSYIFHVRAYHNGKVSAKVSSSSFKTECGTIEIDAEHPWTYGFEDISAGYGIYNIPECWNKIAYGNYPYVYQYSCRTGNRCLYLYGGTSASAQYIVLPPFADVNNLTLSFYYKAEEDFYGYSTYIYAHPEIGYMTDPADASTFVRLGEPLPQSESSYARAEQVLSEVPDGARIAIRYADDGTVTDIGNMYLDDIEMKLSVGCSKPANPTCSSYTSTTATIAWTDYKDVSAWQIEYSENDDFSAPTTVVDADSNPFTLTGLRSNTIYYARVKTICAADDESDWSVRSTSFRTGCGIYMSEEMPYVFDFESGTETGSGNIPYCWAAVSYDFVGYGDEITTYPMVSTSGGRSGNCLQFWGGDSDSKEYVTLPEFEDNLKDLTLEFYYKGSTDATSPQLSIGYMSDPEDGSTFTQVQAIAKANTYTKASVDLKNFPTNVHRISIRWAGGSLLSSCYIDDIVVMPTAYVFTDADGDSDWTNENNWLMGTVPTINDDVVIRKPLIVPAGGTAKAKSVVLDRLTGHNGTIEIAPTGVLVIADTLRKMEGTTVRAAKTYGPTTEQDLIISSSASGNGVLAIGNHDGSNHATIGFYTKAYKDETGYINQFIGQPVNGADNFSNFYGSYLYKFDAATKGWVNQKNGSTSEAFAGYNVLRKDAAPTTMVIQGSLVSSANHVCNLYYQDGDEKTENMIGNSWMAPIDIASMGANEAAAFVNCEATVYIYNSGSKKQQEEAEGGRIDATTPGQYIVIPVNSVSYIAATTVIPPLQAFSVYATADEASLTLNYETMVLNPVKSMSNATATTATKVQRRERMEAEQPEIMKLRVTNENGTSDIVYMLMREDWTTGFENGYDGRKMYGNSSNPQLYAKSAAGEMAVNCVADAEGTLIGLKPGNNNNLTFTFSYDGNRTLYLNDLKEQKSTLINDENSYMFFMDADEAAERFIISSTPFGAPEVATGVDEVESGKWKVESAQKVIYNEKMYILYNGRIYSADGAIVK